MSGSPESTEVPTVPERQANGTQSVEVLERLASFFDPLDELEPRPTLEQMLGTAAAAFCTALKARFTTIWIPNPKTDQLDLAVTTFPHADAVRLPPVLPLEKSRCGFAVRTG